MKPRSIRSFALFCALFAIVLWLALPLQARTFPITAVQNLQQAWRLASHTGRFHYQTNVQQTIHPTVMLKNANRHAQTKQFIVEGELDQPAGQMTIQLHTYEAGQQRVIDLKVEHGQAYGRLNQNATWTPIDTDTGADLFAPGGDPLGFLVAAENVQVNSRQSSTASLQSPIASPDNFLNQLLPPTYAASLTRYTFNLNGVTYAEYMRTQLEETLRRKGELPNGMNLDLVRQYVDMTGSGEIWVNGAGLPVREQIHLRFPPEKGAEEWMEAEVTTNFSQWQTPPTDALASLWRNSANGQWQPWLGQAWALMGLTAQQIQETAIGVGLLGLIVGLVGLIIHYRRARRLYAGLAAALVGTMLIVPLLNAQQVSAFAARQQVKTMTNTDEKAAQTQIEAQKAKVTGEEFDAQRNPLEHRGPLSVDKVRAAVSMRASLAASTCDMTTNTDCDSDGLSNEVEIYKLGTNPFDVDSDHDYISDKLEVQGFTYGGKQWYLNPLNPDTNGDGLIDSLECAGLSNIIPKTGAINPAFVAKTCLNSDTGSINSDLTPDLFDFDNDGDGVPDKVDDSPFSVVGNTATGLTDSQLSFNLAFTGTNQPVFVDFSVRPTNIKHLWYTNNVLDWPSNDTKGQITRVFNTTYADVTSTSSLSKAANGDMLLVPLLEFEITYNAANPSAGLPITSTYSAANIRNYSSLAWLDTTELTKLGISVKQGTTDQTLLMWVPLSLVQDDTGDTPVAWSGRMLYKPASGLANLGGNQKVRLVWMVEGLLDTCDTTNMGSSSYDTWCANKTHWTTSTGVIQTYYDSFMLTGLSVREDHGGKVAILAEPKRVGNANYDDHLWHMADALQAALLKAQAKADAGAPGARFGLSDIAGYASSWGVGDLQISSYTLSDQLDLASVASTYSTAVLNNVFSTASTGDNATLLFAGEDTARTATLSDAKTSISGNTVKLDLTAASLDTQANLRWAPYTYKGAQVWDTLDLETYLSALDTNLQTVFTNSQLDLLTPDEIITDYALVRAGASSLAQNYYLSLYVGASKTVTQDGVRLSGDTLGAYPLGSAEPVTTLVKALLDKMQSYYADLSTLSSTTSSSSTASSTTTANSLAASFAVSRKALVEALGSAAEGNTSTALTLALSELANYYKTTSVATADFTDVGSLTAAAWSSTVSNYSTALSATYASVSSAMAAYTIIWGIKAFNAYSTAITLASEPGVSAATSLTYAAKANSLVKTNVAWAVVTFVITTAVIWTLFALGKYSNHLERNAAIVKAVAETIVAVIMAVIAAIPVFGWIIVGVISLISGLMMAVCAAVGVKSGSTVDVWVCGGLTGTISQAIVYAIYDQYIVPNLNDSNRLKIGLNTPTLTQKLTDGGYLAGNQLTVSATITNTISKSTATGLGSMEHFGYNLNDLLKKSTFLYTLQTSKTDHHAGLSAGALTWQNNTEVFHPSTTFDFTGAGLNQTMPLYLTESFVAPALECWGFLVQICGRSDYKDSFHTYLGEDIVFDILPTTLDQFYALTLVKNSSYRLGWDSKFPTLADADGDGLLSKVKGGSDPDDSNWDTDGDGLSDYWELNQGFDPTKTDSDSDGLSDYWEAFYDTDPRLSDSDNDGLTDAQEFFHSASLNAYVKDSSTWSGGWTIVYAYSGSTKLQTLVAADPNDADTDDDTLTDRQEYVYGYNPNLASVLNVLSLDASVDSTVVAPLANIAYTATIKNELDNRVANGLLQTEFPVDTVQKTQVMETLYPQDETTVTGTLTAPDVNATTTSSLTIRAGAIIQDVNTGRVLWLHLNESTGSQSFSDDAQSDDGPHDATCSGGGCPNANGSFLGFDGNDDRLTIAHDSELNLSNFSASLWVNPRVIKPQTFWAKGDTGLNIKMNSLGKVVASIYLSNCATPVSITSSAALPAGSWQNIIVTYNSATLGLYLNGVSVGSASAASICSNSNNMTLGAASSGNYFAGMLDEVELYTTGKTATEVASLSKKPVFYLSSYSVPINSAYSHKDESDYSAAIVSCKPNATNDMGCPLSLASVSGDGFDFNQKHGLKVTGNSLLDLGAVDNTFTMALWVYPESGYTPDDNHFTGYGQLLLGNDDAGWNKAYPSLYLKGHKIIVRFGHADGAGYCEATSGDILNYDNWQHLTVTFNGAQFKAYTGETLAGTFTGTSCAGQALYSTDDFYIGHGRGSALYFTSFQTDSRPDNDEGFLWSDDTLLNNGYGVQPLIWDSEGHVFDANKTIEIKKWAYSNGPSFNFIMCNRDAAATGGCTGGNNNDTFTNSSGGYLNTVHYYDPVGVKTLSLHNAHGDGTRNWDGTLNYNLYNDGFKGKLDEIRLYRTALSADEVTSVYEGSVRSLKLTFDEAPGQDIFTDSSGNSYDATCSGTACPDSGIPGRDNQAARFDGGLTDDDGYDGVADYLTLKDAETLGLKNGSFTVLAWIKPDTLTGDRAILGTDTGQPQQGLQLLLRNGKPYLGFYNDDTASNTTLPTKQWTHLAWRYDKTSQTQSIFINGSLDIAQAARPPFLGTGTAYVGRALGGHNFDGLIDHLEIIKEALSDDKIKTIMQEAPTLNLHLDENLEVTTFTNDSPYGNAAICVGAACPQAGSKGQVREAPVFAGSDLLTSDLTGYVADGRNMTVGFWVKPTVTKSTAQYLFQSNPFNLFLKPNSADLGVDMGYDTGSCTVGSTADFSASLLQNQWNHVVVTVQTSTPTYNHTVIVTVYVNGAVKVLATKISTCPTVTTVNLGQNFEGSLDEVLLYNTVLDEESVQSLYDYQSSWYDITYQQLITIDADKPLLSIEMSADYLDEAAHWFTFSAVDTGSKVATVQVKLTRPDGSVTTDYATASTDTSAANAWLYEFIPPSAGRYTLQVTATDSVGNQSVASKSFYVDNTVPTIGLDSSLTSKLLTTTIGSAVRTLGLFGQVSDSGSPASGVVTNSVSVNLFDHLGVSVSGSQSASVTGSAWRKDYPFSTTSYGQYTVTMSAADLAGNAITTTVGALKLDDLGPSADIAISSTVISESLGTLRGTVSETPYPSEDRALYLHFEEAAGATTFVDSTSNGVTVTCANCPSAGGAGQTGRAVTFDGANDALTISSLLNPEASKFTVATWFKVNALTAEQVILQQKDGTGTGRPWLVLTTSGQIASDLGGSRLTSASALSTGQWHHAAFTYDGTTLTLYLDGSQTAQATRTLEASDGELIVGANATRTQNFLAGALDELVMYNRALSAEELYRLVHPLSTTITSAMIRFRHAKDSAQSQEDGVWIPLTLDNSNASFTTWQTPLPMGIEGPYKIDLQAIDSAGNSSYIPGAWAGEIDTLAPRLSFTYTPLNANYVQVNCVATDYNITLTHWSCPSSNVTEVPETSAWFVNLFTPYTKTATLEADLTTIPLATQDARLAAAPAFLAGVDNSVALTACDEVGHCVSETITNPTVVNEASAIITPGGSTTYAGLDPIALDGYVRSDHDVRALTVTINGTAIYTTSWASGVSEATWSTTWTPPKFGLYTVEAIMTNGLGQQVSDPVNTLLTVNAPELTIHKTVLPSSRLSTGQPLTYTLVFANEGNAVANHVSISDTLPTLVSGADLHATIALSAGHSITYVIPALVKAGDEFTVTNTAAISHTWQKRQGSATFTRCDDLLVTNGNDSGVGSLRQAIINACTDDAVVRFAGDYSIYLNSTLAINKHVTVDGSGHRVTISGDSGHDGSRNVQPLLINASGVVTLTHLQVVSGTATLGGGIYNAGMLAVVDSAFAANYSDGNLGGGAIYTSKLLTVTNSTFTNNQSNRGGAIFVAGQATVINSTFANNSASEGGAIHNRGLLTLTNTTLASNAARFGSGLHSWGGTLYLRNSMIANNGGNDCLNQGTLVVNRNNLIKTGNCNASLTSDQLLAPLADYEGSSAGSGPVLRTFALLPGSPALDTGDNTLCPNLDQRGKPRYGLCDIGAFEAQGFTFTVTSGNNQHALIKDAFAQPFGFKVQANNSNEPVVSGKVTLTAPSSGASLNKSSTLLTLNASGVASTTVTANGSTGTYTVTANIGGVAPVRSLTLTNTSPDLQISLNVTPTLVVGGDLITYTLNVTNAGTLTATNVVITDVLPTSVAVQQVATSGAVSITHSTSVLGLERFTMASFARGQTGVITVTGQLSGTVTTGDLLTNNASIGWPRAEEVTSNNQASVSNLIPCQAAIVVTNGNDQGGGSLRQAIANLCNGGQITFANDTTIYLDSTLALARILSIDGSGHAITLSGDSGHNGDRNVQILTVSAS
ncbi:MAG: LamG domain-containing protein, partial [Chloroflexi bacterium]|nr:LamG domain-containing protein [Chloroflexota bacterium]